ncbi:MAG: TraR/DksA C4-type zinc finger protein [Pseudomonadota bacterium]
MNAKDRARFRERILADLDALRKKDVLGRDGRKTVVLDQQSVGRLSRMDALMRIDKDEFGYCDICGDALPLKRLELNPTAIRCVGCASE